jgi:hypothetical protein
MVAYSAHSSGSPAATWALIAQPARWHEWAPHMRGAWRLGEPEVELGARGAARLLGVLLVPARVTAKRPGRSWTWQVGPVSMVHRVTPRRGGGCDVAVEISAPPGLERAVALGYGPLVAALVRRLARVAERD